jgi:hypothetical protein
VRRTARGTAKHAGGRAAKLLKTIGVVLVVLPEPITTGVGIGLILGALALSDKHRRPAPSSGVIVRHGSLAPLRA